MSIGNYLKIKSYVFFNTKLGKSILKLLSNFVYTKGLIKDTAKNKLPFIVSITIDTESGYVDKKDYRVWQKSNPEAYIGFYKGVENWREVLNKHNIKATFFLSTNCFSAKGTDYNKIIKQLKLLLKEGHEIGLHIHPDSDLALQSLLKKKFDATSAKFYSKKEINNIIRAGKNLIKKYLEINAISFRWGNWALNTGGVKALQKNSFKIDSSATPGIKGHQNDKMAYDWGDVSEHYPWRLSIIDYQNTKRQNSNILEIPIATFNFFGLKLRADPSNSSLLLACFDYYYKNVDRSKKPFVFVVISHSIEATYENGAPTKTAAIMEEFLQHSKKYGNIKFLTLKDCYNLVR